MIFSRTGVANPSFLGGLFAFAVLALPFNVLSDYVSLFVIRPVLIRSGANAVFGLTLGTVSAIIIVLGANVLRAEVLLAISFVLGYEGPQPGLSLFLTRLPPLFHNGIPLMASAVLVFAWLPLFALGILTARLLTPLSWVSGSIHWKGEAHPLKVIGYIAAVIVFLCTVVWRAVFSA
jgi:hypothetical protein